MKKTKWTLKHYVLFGIIMLGLLAFLGRNAGNKAGGTASAAASKEDMLKERLSKRYERQISENGGDKILVARASQLYGEYQANEVAADAKYKDRWIRVEGRVDSVSKDLSGDPYVTLAVDQYGIGHVRAELFDVQIKDIVGDRDFTVTTALDKAAQLKKGQFVAVEGKGEGTMVSIPSVKECLLMEPSKQ